MRCPGSVGVRTGVLGYAKSGSLSRCRRDDPGDALERRASHFHIETLHSRVVLETLVLRFRLDHFQGQVVNQGVSNPEYL